VSTTLAQNNYYLTEEAGTTFTFSSLMRRRRDMSGDDTKFKTYVKSLPTLSSKILTKLPKMPRAGQMSLEDIDANMQRAGVQVLPGPSTIKQPKNQDVPEFVPGYEEIQDGTLKMTLASKPVANIFPNVSFMKDGKQNRETQRLPIYLPVYQYEPYDKEVMSDVIVLNEHFKKKANYDANPTIADAVSKVFDDLVNTSRNFYFGNGTPIGQMGRHKKCLAIRDQINQALNRKGVVQKNLFPSYKDYVTLMDKRFPLRKVAATLDLSPTEIIDKYETSDNPLENPVFTSISLKSGAGIQWVNLKREEVLPQDYTIADFIYLLFKQNSWDLDFEPAREAFWKRFDWLRLAKCKPKPEPYEIKKLYEDPTTRNIYEMNSCGQVVSQMILKPTHFRTRTWFEDKEVWSILGINFFYGGCDVFIRRMLEIGEGACVVYADNLYVIIKKKDGKLYFLSIDSSKAESSIGRQIVQFEMERSLSHFEGFNAFYKSYARHVHPTLSVDFVAVLGQHQITIPYLGSGTQGTAYFNTVKMIQFTQIWKDLGFSEDTYKKAQESAGVVLEEVTSVPLNVIKQKTQYMFMDLLGFDVVNLLPLFGVDLYVGVLSYTRMLKTILFFKNLSRNEKKLDNLTFNVLKLSRLRSLYMLGGWLYPGIDILLQKMCRKIILDYNLTTSFVTIDPEDFIEEIKSIVGTDTISDLNNVMSIISICTRTEVPSVYEMIEFTGGLDAAMKFAVKMAKDKDFKGMLANLVPLRVYEDLKKLDPSLPEPKLAYIHDTKAGPGLGLNKPMVGIPFKEFLKKQAAYVRLTRENTAVLKEGVKKLWAEEEDEEYEEVPSATVKSNKQLPMMTRPEDVPKPKKVETQHSSLPLKGQFTTGKPSKDKSDYVHGQIMQHLTSHDLIVVSLSVDDVKKGYTAEQVASRIISDRVGVPIVSVFNALKRFKASPKPLRIMDFATAQGS